MFNSSSICEDHIRMEYLLAILDVTIKAKINFINKTCPPATCSHRKLKFSCQII